MKIFVSALISLGVITFAVFGASGYVTEIMRTITDMTKSLPEAPYEDGDWAEISEKAGSIEKYWSEHSRLVCMSVSHTETETVDLAIDKMISSAESRDSGNFAMALAELLHHTDCISVSERLSIDGIM